MLQIFVCYHTPLPVCSVCHLLWVMLTWAELAGMIIGNYTLLTPISPGHLMIVSGHRGNNVGDSLGSLINMVWQANYGCHPSRWHFKNEQYFLLWAITVLLYLSSFSEQSYARLGLWTFVFSLHVKSTIINCNPFISSSRSCVLKHNESHAVTPWCPRQISSASSEKNICQ